MNENIVKLLASLNDDPIALFLFGVLQGIRAVRLATPQDLTAKHREG